MIARALAWADREVSTRPAALLRIALGLVAWSRFAAWFAPWKDPGDLPRMALGAAFYAASAAMIAGWRSQLATLVTGASMMAAVVGLGRFGGRSFFVHHHTLLLATVVLVLALTPCGRSLSVDRWRAVRRAEADGTAVPEERGGALGVTLVALQVSVVYLFGAIDKVTPTFLSGVDLQFVHLVHYSAGTGLPGRLAQALFEASAWVTVLLELALAVGLWWRPARRWLIPAGLALHAVFYVVLPVGTFTVTMFVLYLAFLDPDGVHAGVDRLVRPPS